MSSPSATIIQFPPPSRSVGPPSLYEEKMDVARNLRWNIVEGGPATSMYLDLATDAEIQKYLKDSSLYNTHKKTWTHVVQSAGQTGKAPAAVTQIVQQIMQTLGRSGDAREAIDTSSTPFKDLGVSGLESMSNIVIKAKGPSFEVPESGELGLTNIATCIAFQLNSPSISLADRFYEVAVPAKQILAHQANRRSVRCLFMGETKFSLAHFDCAGAYCTPPLNYHEHPMAFVRVILGLSSQDERVLGFDTTIRWAHDESGRKAEGTVEVKDTVDGKERTTVYRNIQLRVREHQKRIVGRGTTCWAVEHPETGEKLFLKDQFRSEGCQAEGEFIARAKGIPGVVQAVASEPSRASISELRNAGPGSCVLSKNRNMIQSRLVMKMCGKPIDEFDSEKELIAAIRDVIEAHGKLFRYKILHRDISFNNMLFGAKDAPTGWRGNLIDFDLATFTLELDEFSGTCGTRTFQSVNVLRSYEAGHIHSVPLSHDHHDDLQSILYVLLLIVVTMDGPQKYTDFNVPSQARALYDAFNSKNTDAAADYKFKLFSEKTLRRFFTALKPDVLWKEDLRKAPGCPAEKQKAMRGNKMKVGSKELYQRILKFFDDAMESMEGAERHARTRERLAALRASRINVEVVSLINRKRKMHEEVKENKEAAVGAVVGEEVATDENDEPKEKIAKRMKGV